MEDKDKLIEEINNKYDDRNKLDKGKIISNAISIALAIILSAIVLYCLYTIAKPKSSSDIFSSEQMERFEKAAKIIDRDYLYDYDADKLIDGAINGMMEALDNPFTYYEDEEAYQESLNSGSNGNYVGIGVHLSFDKENQAIKVLGIMSGTPAEEAGIQAGDVILKVDDLYVNMDTYMDAVDAIKGEENTNVTLTILRNGETFDVTVARRKVTENNVSSEVIDGIGYIRIYSFDNGIYDQFRSEYDKIMSQNVKGIIIDLRNNPGGLVKDTVKMLDILLPESQVLKLVDKQGRTQTYDTDSKEEITIPLAILVNQNSASAAEIFASAVKDSQKGVVIGTKTFGKGVVQYVEPLDGHGAMYVVAAQYFTSSGVVIQDNGIEPNITVELPDDIKNNQFIDRDKDLQLQRAIQYINEQL